MKKNVIFILAFYTFITACGYYSFYQQTNPHLNTIMVTEFKNDSEKYELPELINNYLTDKFVDDNRLEVRGENADVDVTGTVISYDKTVFSYDEEENPEEWQIAIKFEIEVIDMVKDEILWKNNSLILKSIYSKNNNLNEKEKEVELYSEDEAIENIVDELADNILSNIFESW